jgi:5-methylcytosine-specific restriction endonuclease McrA
VDQWRVLTDPAHVRATVWRRDRGVCALCHSDTMAGLKNPRPGNSAHLWQADHIVPVAEGGGECGLDNYRTLCTACHKRETAALRRRLAERKRRERVAPLARPLRFGEPDQIEAKRWLGKQRHTGKHATAPPLPAAEPPGSLIDA